jgi:hypothetical protein
VDEVLPEGRAASAQLLLEIWCIPMLRNNLPESIFAEALKQTFNFTFHMDHDFISPSFI